MKKLIITAVSALTLVSGTITISGKNENSLISDYKEVEMQNEDVINAFTFYSEEDDIEYLVVSKENQITVQNNQTGALIHTVDIVSNENVVSKPSVVDNMNYFIDKVPRAPKNNIDSYEKWSSYVCVTEKSAYISSFESHTASTIAGILGGLVGGMGGSVLASSLVWAATEIHNNKYGNLKVKSYNSWNIYCGILVKYRYDYFGNNKQLTSTHQAPTWLTTPWDYANQPAECRVLAERY